MTDSISINLEGMQELDDKLQALGVETGAKVLRGSMMTATKPLMDEMKNLVPVDEGTLKGSIGRRGGVYKGEKTAKRFQEMFSNNKETAVVVQVGAIKKGAWRAHFIELGTDHNPPQPFIRAPFHARQRDIVERMKASLAKRINKIANQ